MRLPFAALVGKIEAMTAEEHEMPFGQLAEKWGGEKRGITPARIMDAIECWKLLHGEGGYIRVEAENV